MQQKQEIRKSTKHAQAALEFLTTYGWAFIIILTAIGALAYFGILRIEPPDRCSLGSEFICHDFQLEKIEGDGVMTVVLSNSKDFMMDITGGSCTFPNNQMVPAITVITMSDWDTAPPPYPNSITDWEPGEKRYMQCRLVGDDGGLTTGDKAKVRFTIIYTNKDLTGFDHTVDGEVVARTN